MKAVFIIQGLLIAIATPLILILVGPRQSGSYLLGALLVLINLALLTWTWSRILRKKQIAIAASIIVFKYGIFAVILYGIFKQPSIEPAWFSIGLSTLLVTVLVMAMKTRIVGGEDVL